MAQITLVDDDENIVTSVSMALESLGHDVKAMQSPGFQTLMIRGLQWAATGEVHYPVPADVGKSGQQR